MVKDFASSLAVLLATRWLGVPLWLQLEKASFQVEKNAWGPIQNGFSFLDKKYPIQYLAHL